MILLNGAIIDKTSLKRRIWRSVLVSINAVDRKLFEVRSAIKDVSDQVEIPSFVGRGIAIRQTLNHKDPPESHSAS
jgi:DNA-binding winged helix-turn-helix (wHTH) protein